MRNDITEIESEITTAKEKLEPPEDFVSESWKLLNEVGIYTKDAEVDDFPDLDTHYVSRRKGKRHRGKMWLVCMLSTLKACKQSCSDVPEASTERDAVNRAKQWPCR